MESSNHIKGLWYYICWVWFFAIMTAVLMEAQNEWMLTPPTPNWTGIKQLHDYLIRIQRLGIGWDVWIQTRMGAPPSQLWAWLMPITSTSWQHCTVNTTQPPNKAYSDKTTSNELTSLVLLMDTMKSKNGSSPARWPGEFSWTLRRKTESHVTPINDWHWGYD